MSSGYGEPFGPLEQQGGAALADEPRRDGRNLELGISLDFDPAGARLPASKTAMNSWRSRWGTP